MLRRTDERSRLRLSALQVCVLLACFGAGFWSGHAQPPGGSLRELNNVPSPNSGKITAIVGARLVDGLGGRPVADSAVVILGERIVATGARDSLRIPAEAEIIDASGMTLLPGLIDAHFHLGRSTNTLPDLFLKNGITSARDPGAWIEKFEPLLDSERRVPRLFLTGPHLDMAPAAYPENSFLVNDPAEGRRAVERFVTQGASAIKVYFRLPLATIRAICEAAHARNVPVTAHLELVNAVDAIRAGLDGIEHVTSFGTALAEPRDAERFRQSVMADNAARQEGRYELWSKVDLASSRVADVIDLIVERGIFVSPNLAIFERQPGDKGTTEMHVTAHRNMMRFIGVASEAGARIVVGSHSNVPHAERGWVYHREMELLVESGMSPTESIVAATMENARFFRIADRLGSVEAGKQADLLLVEGNPLADIANMRKVKGVMLNGAWIERPSSPATGGN